MQVWQLRNVTLAMHEDTPVIARIGEGEEAKFCKIGVAYLDLEREALVLPVEEPAVSS
jgi:hypothetical protein